MISPSDLITPAYRQAQAMMHAGARPYGEQGHKWATAVRALVDRFSATSVLDYGCGSGSLRTALRPLVSPIVRIAEYDPAIVAKNDLPVFADLVVCTDVLEHVEPARLAAVLAHLHLLARRAVFVVISTRPAKHRLPDGRNAHLIVESQDWWLDEIQSAGFDLEIGPARPGKPARPGTELSLVLTHRRAMS